METIKNIFIPHKHNKFRPHLIRTHGLVLSLALILLVQVVYNYQNTGEFHVLGYATNINSSTLLSLTNQNRTANGLTALKSNTKLTTAAQNKAQHMIANDYWAHVAPDGTTPWVFINNSGYTYTKAGENLAYGYSTSAATVEGWMNSPSHRDNILTAEYKDVGFGIANGANFQGGENTIVVAMYANPTTVAPAPPAPTPEPEEPSIPITTAPTTPDKPIEKPAETPEVKDAVETEEEVKIPRIDLPAVTAFGSEPESNKITNLQALLTGSASWALYVTSMILVAIGSIYTYRHIVFIQTIIVRGEHIMHAHPLLEASMMYVVIWVVLSAQYGVIK